MLALNTIFFSHICKAHAHVVMRLIRLNYPFPGPRLLQTQIAFLPFYSQGLNLPSPRPGVPVWRLPSPSRSMHLGDVSETSPGPRDPNRIGCAQ